MARAGLIAVAVVGLLTWAPVAAQAPLPIVPLPADVRDLRFEAATIKENKSGDPRMRFDGRVQVRYAATNAPFAALLRAAFRLQGSQLAGLPEWASSVRYDIVAKAPEGPPTIDRQLAMLRNLFIDRFGLTFHVENREMPLYALVKARPDARLGPMFKPSSVDCLALNAAQRGGGPGRQTGNGPTCALTLGAGRVASAGLSIPSVVSALAPFVDRLIVDRSGLTGFYELDLRWTPEQFAGRDTPASVNGIIIDPNGPGLFTAIQEQLGLKLEPVTGPVEVMVIDRLERPTED
jgi:uncharacterized protein (TIGR03435 family)